MADSMSGPAEPPTRRSGPGTVTEVDEVADGTGGASGVTRARRLLVWLVVGEVVLLAATGAYLVFFYRPTAAQSWSEIYRVQRGGVNLAIIVRTVHRGVAQLTVLTATVLAGVAMVEALSRWNGPRRRRSSAITGPAVLLVLIAASLTGSLIAWDQLALWAVTVGTDVAGFRTLLTDDQVRFVLIGGSEVSVGTVRTWLIVHALVVPLLLAGLLWLLGRARPETHADPEPEWQE